MKKIIKVHFNRSKIFPLYFHDTYDVNLWEKKVRQKYGLFMQKKCLYRISSFNEKTIDITEDWATQAKHFLINRNLWVFLNWIQIYEDGCHRFNLHQESKWILHKNTGICKFSRTLEYINYSIIKRNYSRVLYNNLN